MNKYPLECPFCKRYIARPETTLTGFGEILSGRCACGAVYVCDPTGHNTGEAYMEALAMAMGDWNLSSMSEGIDYQMVDMDYDFKNHRRVYSRGFVVSGKLIFVKQGFPVAKEERVVHNFSALKEDSQQSSKKGRTDSKGRIRELLETMSFEEIAGMALKDKGVIRWLISLSYDKEDVISWRAMEAMGAVAFALSAGRGKGIEIIRDAIRRLLWSMGEESGGIGWSAAEMLGEIIRANPDEFSDIIPIVWSFREEEMFRAGVVRAMWRIADVRTDLVRFISKDLAFLLTDENPSVRVYALLAAGTIGEDKIVHEIKGLVNDSSEIKFYHNGILSSRTVGDIAKELLDRLIK
jgi:hypothetical protein